MNQDNKSANKGNIILILIAMLLGMIIGLMFASHGNMAAGEHSLQDRMAEVAKLVENEYVDEIDVDSLSERLVAAMLGELDPHSTYLSARETERSVEMLRGSFEGVGIVLRHEGDSVYVGQVMADGPSAGIGLIPGDLIWQVDGHRVSGVHMQADSVVSLLRGPRRSTVQVTIKRTAANYEEHQFKIRRGVVSHRTVNYSAMLNDTTGYIFLSSFASTSYDEFHNALRSLCDKGMRHLVFDLRGNAGGSLSAAVAIANELLPAGSPIVYTQGAHQSREDVVARPGGLFTTGRVTVMVDESSASASEVVSGALQDNDRALIVGRRTFGKGLVQREFNLRDGSSVHLTVARYYTPSGRSIQRPYSQGSDEYYREYLERLMEESYADNPTLHVTDSTPYHTRSGRIVYGGGGIFPDRLLPYQKDSTLVYYNRLSQKGLTYRIAFDEVRLHAPELLKRFPDADTFYRGYRVSDETLQRLIKAGTEAGVPYNAHSFAAQRRLISSILKANIGNWLYGDAAFYRIYLEEDNDLQRVLKQDYPKNNTL